MVEGQLDEGARGGCLVNIFFFNSAFWVSSAMRSFRETTGEADNWGVRLMRGERQRGREGKAAVMERGGE